MVEQNNQIQQARSQLESQRQQLAEAESKAKQQIEEAKKRLPNVTSQEALRTKFAGMQGREQRQLITKRAELIKGEEQRIKSNIEDYKSQLSEQEKQINKAEEQQAAYNRAIEAVNRKAQGKSYGLDPNDTEAYKIVNQIMNDPNLKKQLYSNIDVLTSSNIKEASYQASPTEYAKSTPYQQAISEGYTPIKDIKGTLIGFNIPEPKLEISMLTLDRTVRTNEGLMKPALYSDNKDLNMSNTSKSYAINLPLNISTGMDMGIQSNTTRKNNIFSNILNIFNSGSKAGSEKAKEVYIPELGGFASAEQVGVGAKSETIQIIRPISFQELEQRDIITNPVAKYIFGERASGNILTARISDLQNRYKNAEIAERSVGEIKTKLDELNKNINPEGSWVGSKEDLDKYNKLVEDYNINVERTKSTIGIGLFGSARQVPISSLSTTLKGDRAYGVFSSIEPLGLTLEQTAKYPYQVVSEYLEVKSKYGGNKILPKEAFTIIPATKFTYPTKSTIVAQGYYNPLEVNVPERKVIKQDIYNVLSGTTEIAGSLAGFGGRIAPYVNPLGSVIFYGQEGERLFYNLQENERMNAVINLDTKKMELGGINLLSTIKAGTKSWFKESPIESTIALAIPTYQIARKANRFLTEPIFTYEKLPVNAQKGIGVIGAPSKVISQGKKTVTLFEDVYGASQTAKVGQKTIVTSRIRNILGLEPTYSGSPYGINNLKSYQNVLQLLQKKGYSESQARQILRLRKPEKTQYLFRGKAIVTETEEGTTIGLKGIETAKKVKGVIEEVPYGLGESKIRYIDTVGKPEGNIKDTDMFRFNQEIKQAFLKNNRAYSKISQAGKTTTTSEVLTGVKAKGTGGIPKKVFEEGIAVGVPAGIYEEASISRQIIPLKKNLAYTKSKIYVEQGEPKVYIDLDEILGTPKVEVIKGGGKKSSEQYLKNLYKGPEQEVSSALSIVTNKPIPKPKIEATTEIKTNIVPISQRTEVIETKIIPAEVVGPINSNAYVQFSEGYRGESELNPDQFRSTSWSKEGNRSKQDIFIDFANKSKNESILDRTNKDFNLGGSKFKELPETKLNEKIKFDERQLRRLSESTKQNQKLQSLTALRMLTEQKTTQPKTPKPSKLQIAIPILGTGSSKESKQSSALKVFEILKRAKGGKEEFIKVGEEQTLFKAGKKAREVLKSGLEATAEIREKGTGRKVSYKEVAEILGKEFRASKRSPTLLIQREKFRLGTRSEVGKIQIARKKSGGRKVKWLS